MLKKLAKANIKSIVILVGNSQDFKKERKKNAFFRWITNFGEKQKVRRRKKSDLKSDLKTDLKARIIQI